MPQKPRQHRPPGHTRQKREARREQDQRRGSAAERGYTRKWREHVAWLRQQPEFIFCACGCGELMQCVDHIEAVSGASDPLFWDLENHQPMTNDCHRRKTIEIDGGFGHKPVSDATQRIEVMKAAARARAAVIRARGECVQ